MKHVIISKNGTIIPNYKKGECKSLEYNTSIRDNVYHKRVEVSGFIMENYLGNKCFITHNQSIEYIKSLYNGRCNIEKMPFNRALYMGHTCNMNPGINLTELQSIVSVEILNGIDKYNEFFINMPTASGKTVLGTYISLVLQMKTLVLCYSTNILKNWIRTYEDKTTIDNSRIYFINDSNFFNKKSFDPDKYDIYVCTHSMITSMMKIYDLSDFYDIFNKLGVGLCIMDEAHRNMSSMIKFNALTNIKYTLYSSADYGQSNFKTEGMYFNIFNNAKIIKIPERFKSNFKYTDIVVYLYNTEPSDSDKVNIRGRYGFSASKYMEYQMNNNVILDVIEKILSMINSKGKLVRYKTLILIPNVAHVDIAYDTLVSKFPNINIVKYYGDTEYNIYDDIMVDADVMIATYKSFDTGIDMDNIKYVIGTNQSDKISDNQAAGRSRPLSDGSNALYFMLVDEGFQYCKDKLKSRLRYLQEHKSSSTPSVVRYTANRTFKL